MLVFRIFLFLFLFEILQGYVDPFKARSNSTEEEEYRQPGRGSQAAI